MKSRFFSRCCLASPLPCVLLILLVFACACGEVRAAEWQWSVPIGETRAYLWVPEKCQRIRAVVVSNHNMIEQGILEHPTMRGALRDLDIAEIWVVPYLDLNFDFNKGSGEHFQSVVDALAQASGYTELASAPVIPLGHSACATYPWNFGAWNPARTLAILSVHGDAPQTDKTGYGRPNIDWGDHNINGVPGLMVMGQYEWGEERITPAFKFMEKNPDAPIAFLADAGHGHFDYSDRLVSFLAMFIRKAAEARLPAAMPAGGPVTLKPVHPQLGWRIDRWRKDEPPTAPAAPYGKYSGNPKQAFWCFDQEMVRATEDYYAANRGKLPQLVSITDLESPVEKGCGEPVNPRFVPMEDGISFRLKTAFLEKIPENNSKATFWTGLPSGFPVGHASGGGPIDVSWIVGPCVKISPDTFAYSPGRAEYTANRRNFDIWLVASHPGDSKHRSVVQQACVHVPENKEGAPQRITFPEIADQKVGTKSIKLGATSDANLPVHYFVLEGPAEVVGDVLRFTPVPPRAAFPVKVTVVAWQYGSAREPKVQTAERVERTFQLVTATPK